MEDSPGVEFPKVSVVIPVRNRPAGIRSCIDSLVALDYPRDRFEIIVVDDASTDETPSAVASYDRGSVRLLAQAQHRGQSECRNVGARAGTGDVVAFIDSDCIADAAWLRTLVRDLEDSNVVASGGSVREASPNGWLKRYESSVSPLHMGETSARVMPGSQVEFLPSCNVAVRKQVFLEVGGFDASLRFGEDVDLVWRLIERGEVRYRPAGVVWHEHRGRLGPFLLNRINYATAQAVFLSRFPGNRRRVDAPAGMALGAAVAIGLAVIHPAFVAVVLVPALAEATAAVVSARGSESPIGAAVRVLAGYASSAYRALSSSGDITRSPPRRYPSRWPARGEDGYSASRSPERASSFRPSWSGSAGDLTSTSCGSSLRSCSTRSRSASAHWPVVFAIEHCVHSLLGSGSIYQRETFPRRGPRSRSRT